MSRFEPRKRIPDAGGQRKHPRLEGIWLGTTIRGKKKGWYCRWKVVYLWFTLEGSYLWFICIILWFSMVVSLGCCHGFGGCIPTFIGISSFAVSFAAAGWSFFETVCALRLSVNAAWWDKVDLILWGKKVCALCTSSLHLNWEERLPWVVDVDMSLIMKGKSHVEPKSVCLWGSC